MSPWQIICTAVYCVVVVVLSVYGFHRYLMLRLFYRHRRQAQAAAGRFAELPVVTVQLPLYNEFHVAERLIDAVCRLDYPRDRLQVQVLDDSQDETCHRAVAAVARWSAQGVDIARLHRTDRTGFKAGALQAGMAGAKGEFILIFDADFLPPPQILQQAIHHFIDPQIGMVQLRWGHLNRGHSPLTRIQAIFLDSHFVVEHTARNRSGRFFNFNGTAGIWRKTAILDAGGWQHDTLTEDLDLSYRAQLAGWRFRFLPEIEVPGEIPEEINAFKAQQHRWTKGAVQTGKKILPRIWRSTLPMRIKVEATFHLTAHLCYLLMWLMALLMWPMLTIRSQLGWERMLIVDLPLFSMATLAISSFYLAAQRELYADWRSQIKYLPILMAIGMGLCVNNARAVVEGLAGHVSPFLRTPKSGGVAGAEPVRRKYTNKVPLLFLVELGMACYFAVVVIRAWDIGLYAGMPFLLLFLSGFLYTGLSSAWRPCRRIRHSSRPGKIP
ncbi:MAG: glycosyltransferase family 2 protein [Candidatus Handelsmanbacteria bacterium]|nr:glycosyltransferase family 2 protein [Candidatus Handelsmanbacteria bacterium]